MIQVRKNIFETNSSSTHSLVIATKEDWAAFKNNELVLDLYKETLKPVTDKMPKQNAEGKWEFQNEVYDSILDIESRDFEWYDRCNLFNEAMDEMCVEDIVKDLGDGRVAVSIYAHED